MQARGSIDLSQAQNPQNVGEDISYGKEYGQLENVTIVGSLTIKNNSTVKVYGGFNVNEGVTLTIEKGSTLEINSNVASMIVDGRIVVEEDGNLIVTAAKDVKVSADTPMRCPRIWTGSATTGCYWFSQARSSARCWP